MNAPSVSVVVPTWGESGWLGRCLEALSRQTLRDFEVIVVWNEARSNARPRIPPATSHAIVSSDAFPISDSFPT